MLLLLLSRLPMCCLWGRAEGTSAHEIAAAVMPAGLGARLPDPRGSLTGAQLAGGPWAR